jgi:hypothetical protein
MSVKNRFFLVLLLAILTGPVAAFAQSGRETEVTGTIYNDKNKNRRFDSQDTSAKKTKVWLYRVFDDGRRKKIRRVTTDANGRYNFGAMPTGKYFIAARLPNKLSIRTAPFVLNGVKRLNIRNIPVVTRATINQYPGFSVIANPANLDDQGGTSPFAPGT